MTLRPPLFDAPVHIRPKSFSLSYLYLSTSILYAVVKELAEEEILSCGKIGFGSNVLETAYCIYQVCLVYLLASILWSGPDWTRTSDPALIKRML